MVEIGARGIRATYLSYHALAESTAIGALETSDLGRAACSNDFSASGRCGRMGATLGQEFLDQDIEALHLTTGDG